MKSLGNIQSMSQTELRDLISEKASELHGLIEQIDENTQFEAFGTNIYGVVDKEKEEDGAVAGFTLYGRTIDIAQVIRREELTHLQMALTVVSEFEEGDDE